MSWKNILKNEMAENTEEDDSYYWQGAFSKFENKDTKRILRKGIYHQKLQTY